MSLITSMITIYCGLFYLSEIPEELMRKNPDVTNGLQLSEDMKLFFFAAIIIANLFFFIYWGYKMYLEVKSKFRNTLPKFYTFLCLCGDDIKFEREQEQSRIQTDNDHLREDFFRCKNKAILIHCLWFSRYSRDQGLIRKWQVDSHLAQYPEALSVSEQREDPQYSRNEGAVW